MWSTFLNNGERFLFTVEPELEYVLKSQPALLNSEWVPHPKDLVALEWLKGHRRALDVDVSNLETHVRIGVYVD